MDRYEYMKLLLENIPSEIIQQYKLQELSNKCFLRMEIQKYMYGLPQSGIIAYDTLKLHPEKFGYEPAPITTGLWRLQTRPLQFSLLVDDFGVKYECQADITYLLDSLKTIYKISEYWYGKLFCGLRLEWY